MAVTMMRQELTATLDEFERPAEPPVIRELGRADKDEVVQFLAVRPIHTVFMAGLIRDNGLLSPHNRGSFYGCHNQLGRLEGVALIGHATLVEARTEDSLLGFAEMARNCQNAHLIRGEREMTQTFWNYFASPGCQPRQVSHELLFGLSDMMTSSGAAIDLRPATAVDLDKIVALNSAMARDESGTSPMQRDPSGFRHRVARRIEQGRVWAWFDGRRLIFKADVVSETPEAAYLEGIYVHPEERRKGHGTRCLRQLSKMLLQRCRSICLAVNQRNKNALAFYTKVGYQLYSHYETIYLR